MKRAPLAQHVADTTYELLDPPYAPQVRIAPDALAKMACYVGQCSKEVGWFGTVTKFPETETEFETYVIDDVYMFSQQVSAVTTEMDASGQSALFMQMLEEDGFDPAIRVNRLLVWGHSHVYMDTSPSGQDDQQMRDFRANGCPFMIRLIANKRGRVCIDVYDYQGGMAWKDVQWTLDIPSPVGLDAQIAAELKEKVRNIEPAPLKKKGGKKDQGLMTFTEADLEAELVAADTVLTVEGYYDLLLEAKTRASLKELKPRRTRFANLADFEGAKTLWEEFNIQALDWPADAPTASPLN